MSCLAVVGGVWGCRRQAVVGTGNGWGYVSRSQVPDVNYDKPVTSSAEKIVNKRLQFPVVFLTHQNGYNKRVGAEYPCWERNERQSYVRK